MYTNLIRNYFLHQSHQKLQENDPLYKYREIGNFAGEVNKSLIKQGVFSYVFVPKEMLHDNVKVEELPYYEIQSNINENELRKLIESLKKVE